MDPNLQALAVQLADTALRNTTGAIADRITAAKARKQDQTTIAELEEIISGLLMDKAELVRIAQAFHDEFVAERISSTDIGYITENLLPIVRQLVEVAASENDGDASSTQAMIDLLQPILSIETVTVLQLIGFNFRRAIGQPLTELVARLIMAKAQASTDLGLEVQKLAYEREIAYLDVARDPEAFARLRLIGDQAHGHSQ